MRTSESTRKEKRLQRPSGGNNMLAIILIVLFVFSLVDIISTAKKIIKKIKGLFAGEEPKTEFSVDACRLYIHITEPEEEAQIISKKLSINDIDDLVKQLKAEKRKMK